MGFPIEALRMRNPTSGGGGGSLGPITRYYNLGATSSDALTRASSANTLFLSKITTSSGTSPDGCEIAAIALVKASTTTAGIHLFPVIYSDNAGVPGTLLGSGNVYTSTADGTDTDVSLRFASPILLTVSTSYWIGYIADGAFAARGNNGTQPVLSVAATYASGAPASPTGFTTNPAGICCYAAMQDDQAVTAAVGYISNANSNGNSAGRLALPADRGPNDIALIHINYENSSGAPTWVVPAGFTLALEHQIGAAGNYRQLVYWRRLDGTEPLVSVSTSTGGYSGLTVVVSIWRGYASSGTPYEAIASTGGTNTNPTGTTITTLGANRTVINTYSNSSTAALNGGGASGWTDKYDILGSNNYTALSCKDVAVAGSVTAESRTQTSQWWESFTFALIKA